MLDDDRDKAGKLAPILFGQLFDRLEQVVPSERPQPLGRLILIILHRETDQPRRRRLARDQGDQVQLMQTVRRPVACHGQCR